MIGNHLLSVTAKTSLTVRRTCQAETKVGRSDPVLLNGICIAYRIKGTPGITGLSRPKVHIDGEVWHLDVDSSHPGAGEGPKGSAVRRLKRYMSWVKIVVRQIGFYLLQAFGKLRRAAPCTRGSEWVCQWCISCGASRIA